LHSNFCGFIMNRTSKLLVALCCVVAFSILGLASQVAPQEGTTAKSKSSNKAQTRSRTRARRKPVSQSQTIQKQVPTSETDAAAPVVEEPAPQEKAAPEKTEASGESREAEATTQAVEEPATPAKTDADPIQTLRDQIEAAATPVERTRLRMQLVDKLIADDKKQDAINELRAISFEEHFDPQGLYNAGNALARLGDSDGAIGAYHKAIEQRKGRYSRALNNLGVMFLRQGRWDEAYQAFMSALRQENFRYAEASYNMGRLYSARGETDLAVREWRRALALNPDHKAAAQAISGAGEQNQITVVSAVKPPPYKAPSNPRKDPPQPEKLSTRPQKVTHSSSLKTLTIDPDTFDYLQRARNAREREREEDAITNYRRVISRMGGYFGPANLELGYSLINLNRLDEAIAVLSPVATREGERYPISYYHLARLYEGRGELKLAEENFTRAATYYRSNNIQFLLDVSRVREKLGDYQGALSVLEDYLAMLEQKNVRPDWSAERLAALKQRIAAAGNKP
jgi:tetratricopeptide (TPR) repeat protein